MLRRALNFIKKICAHRGYILYVPTSNNISFNSLFLLRQRRKGTATKTKKIPKNFMPLGTYKESSQRSMMGEHFCSPRRMGEQKNGLEKNSQGRISFLLSSMSSSQDMKEKRLFIPEALFLLNLGNKNKILIKEAIKVQIPVIGVLDSDSNPFGIQYPIPGNDDSLESIKLYTTLVIQTIIDMKKKEVQDIGHIHKM